MRIGIVTEYFYPTLGGIQEHVYHFGLEAQKKGHDVHIFTSQVRDLPDNDNHGLVALPTTHVGVSLPLYNNGSVARISVGFHLGRKLQEAFARERLDIIHIHSPLTPTLPLLAITRADTATVGTVHTNFDGSFFLRLLSRKLIDHVKRLDGLIAVSKTAASAIGRYFNTDFRIIPNGVDVSQFSPQVPRITKFDDDQFNLLWVGRMEPRNGLDRMINAFTLARAKRKDLRLVVVGDGPLAQTYRSMVPRHLRDSVHFMGSVNVERPALFSTADVLCTPATISSFGITLLEGMAAGIPIIASDIPGFTDVMTHEKEGMLIDTRKTDVFAGAILRLANDRPLAKTFGERGRQTALTYSWPVVTDKILDFYQEAIARRRSRS